MRELNYAVKGKVANLRTFVLDEPGQGGACHEYLISGPDGHGDSKTLGRVTFQNGPINEGVGINGVQNEDLLAIVIDRLEGFQKGPYAHGYNCDALKSIRCALASLQQRTRDRIARNVEGTHQI